MDDRAEQPTVFVVVRHTANEGGFVVGVAADSESSKRLAEKDHARNESALPLVWREIKGTALKNFRTRWEAQCSITDDYIVEEWSVE